MNLPRREAMQFAAMAVRPKAQRCALVSHRHRPKGLHFFISLCPVCGRRLQASAAIRRATYTPLAEACESECVTPLPSPMMYNPR